MMKKTLALLLALCMIFSLCACGSKTEELSKEPNETQTAARTDLNVVIGTVLGTNDVQQNSQISGQLLMWNVYEGLFFVKEDSGELEPRIAESYDLADDNVTYTVHLRKGVKFHNGQELTADDVVYSFERIRNFPAYAANYEKVASVEKVDDYTVKIVSAIPYVTFMSTICSIKIVNKADAEKFGEDAGLDLDHTMAGTGPYYFTEFNPDTSITLAAFEDYYRGPAEIKEVHYKVMTDASTVIAALETGEVDFASVSTANVPVIESNDDLQAILNPSTHDSYLKFNWVDNKALADKRVRQAICYAIDKEEIMYGAYDGYGDIAENFAREGLVFGGTTDGVNTYPHDPEKAKALLAEAGYADGLDIGTIWAIGTNYFAKGAQIIEQQLAEVGITVKCQLLEQKAVENAIFRYEDSWDLAFHGGAMSVDSDNFYNWMFNPTSGTYVGKGSGGKVIDINARLLELGEAAKSEFDSAKRAEMYKEFWQIAQDEAYVVSVFHRYNAYGAAKDLNAVLGVNYYYLYDFSWN